MPQILPPALAVLLTLLMIPVTILSPGMPMIPVPFHWAGLAVAAAGLFFLRTGHRTFMREKTEIHTFREPDKLVTSGVYRISRNPMYLGFLLILAGIAACTNEALNLLLALVFFLAAHFWYIPAEERNAANAFGAAYEDYKSRVRRWI